MQCKGHRVDPCSGKFPHVVIQLFSHIQLFAIPWTAAHQASLSFTSPRFCSDSWPFSHSTISSSVPYFPSCPQSFPESGSFPMNQLLKLGGQSIGASASASVLPVNIQSWSPCSSRDSQESSPAPQFESISSSALSLCCGPTLTSVHDYWKNHSFD